MKSLRLGNLTARILTISLGVMLFFPSALKLYRYGVFRAQAVSVIGVVEDPMRGRGMGGKPFVSYRDREGNRYEKRSEAKTHWFYAPRKGEPLRVYYLEKDPETAIVGSTFHYVLFPLLLAAAGAAAVGCAVIKRRPHPDDSPAGENG